MIQSMHTGVEQDASATWEQFLERNPAARWCKNAVTCKWVFDVKTHEDGRFASYKARLVARGFTQVKGEDYNQTFAPTVRMDTLRLFLAMVAKEDLECTQYDIKNAFTESHLQEKIYLTERVVVKKGHVLEALRSLYGLTATGTSLLRESSRAGASRKAWLIPVYILTS